MPGDPGDIGNWGSLLGTVSRIVEASFIVLAVCCLARLRRFSAPHRPASSRRAAPALEG